MVLSAVLFHAVFWFARPVRNPASAKLGSLSARFSRSFSASSSFLSPLSSLTPGLVRSAPAALRVSLIAGVAAVVAGLPFLESRAEYAHHKRLREVDPGVLYVDEVDKVFHIFRRGHSAAVQKVPGKGVGLSSVKSIVEMYSGSIWVESALGEGSCFNFTINGKYVGERTDAEMAAENAGPAPQASLLTRKAA